MTGFRHYGNNLSQQRKTLECIKSISSQYACVACGHGHPRNYHEIEKDNVPEKSIKELKESDIEKAPGPLLISINIILIIPITNINTLCESLYSSGIEERYSVRAGANF